MVLFYPAIMRIVRRVLFKMFHQVRATIGGTYDNFVEIKTGIDWHSFLRGRTSVFSVSQATQIAAQAFLWELKAIVLSGMPGETVSFSVHARAGSVLTKTFCPFSIETFAKLSDNLFASAVSIGIVPAKVCGKETMLSVTLYLPPSAQPGLIDGNLLSTGRPLCLEEP
jgi:hypothetical protein